MQGLKAYQKVTFTYLSEFFECCKKEPLQNFQGELIKQTYFMKCKLVFDVTLVAKKMKIIVPVYFCPVQSNLFVNHAIQNPQFTQVPHDRIYIPVGVLINF